MLKLLLKLLPKLVLTPKDDEAWLDDVVILLERAAELIGVYVAVGSNIFNNEKNRAKILLFYENEVLYSQISVSFWQNITFIKVLQQFLRIKQGILEQMRVIDTRPHRHGHPDSIRDNEHRNGHRKAKNWHIREAADAKKSHFFSHFPSPYLSIYSRYIPDTFPTHTRYICICHEYPTNTP